MVSVKAAKKMAIEQHGSTEVAEQNLADRRECGLLYRRGYPMSCWYQACPLQTIEPGTWEKRERSPVDEYCGMASISFPSLSAARVVDEGFWCLGCDKIIQDWFEYMYDPSIDDLEDSGADVRRVLSLRQDRARSEKHFVEHIRHCLGVKGMMRNLEEELRAVL